MARIIRRFISSGLLVCVIAASGIRADQPVTTAQSSAQAPVQLSYRLMEVRLRRLHLARPDLIPYPIAYEFIC
ncbi:MAG TPA: hypothetical protein VHX86_01830 [Tepidisphaeraceae bacterium]|nr:hypothetical protein [Tepidisphaeraceae bacterium]